MVATGIHVDKLPGGMQPHPLIQPAHQLLDIQRVSRRPGNNAAQRRARLPADKIGDQPTHRRLRQWAQHDPCSPVLQPASRQRMQIRRAGSTAPYPDQQQRQLPSHPPQPVQQQNRGRIRPVQVIDRHRHRAVRVPLLDQPQDRLDDRILRTGAPDQGENRHTRVTGCQRLQAGMHRGERQPLVELLRRAAHPAGKQPTSVLEEGPQQPGLANTRLAFDQHQPAPTHRHLTGHAGKAGQFAITADQMGPARPGHTRGLAARPGERNQARHPAGPIPAPSGRAHSHRRVASPAAIIAPRPSRGSWWDYE